MTYKIISKQGFNKTSNLGKKFQKVQINQGNNRLQEMLNQKETLGFMEYQNTSTKLVVRLDDEIKDVSYYADVIERMNNLTENDQVEIVLNSVGGDAHGAMAIIAAIESTDAVVVAIVEGRAHSAASLILMHCDGAAVGKYAHSLCHVWSNFDGGKAPDFDSSYNFNRKFLREFIEDSYKYFLTEEEIAQMLDGKDYWFDSEELIERIQRRYEGIQAELEESEEQSNESCECNSLESNESCTGNCNNCSCEDEPEEECETCTEECCSGCELLESTLPNEKD